MIFYGDPKVISESSLTVEAYDDSPILDFIKECDEIWKDELLDRYFFERTGVINEENIITKTIKSVKEWLSKVLSFVKNLFTSSKKKRDSNKTELKEANSEITRRNLQTVKTIYSVNENLINGKFFTEIDKVVKTIIEASTDAIAKKNLDSVEKKLKDLPPIPSFLGDIKKFSLASGKLNEVATSAGARFDKATGIKNAIDKMLNVLRSISSGNMEKSEVKELQQMRRISQSSITILSALLNTLVNVESFAVRAANRILTGKDEKGGDKTA